MIPEITNEFRELLIQSIDGVKWPCLCGKLREKESDLLCGECWQKIPENKRLGFAKLDPATEEHLLAAEQILRIAKRNSTK